MGLHLGEIYSTSAIWYLFHLGPEGISSFVIVEEARNLIKEQTQKITVPDQLEESHWNQQQERQLGTYQGSPQQCPMSSHYAKDRTLLLQNITTQKMCCGISAPLVSYLS